MQPAEGHKSIVMPPFKKMFISAKLYEHAYGAVCNFVLLIIYVSHYPQQILIQTVFSVFVLFIFLLSHKLRLPVAARQVCAKRNMLRSCQAGNLSIIIYWSLFREKNTIKYIYLIICVI